jgi:hypothetical protein
MIKLLSTPKELIIDAVVSQLAKNDIEKLVLSFNVMNDKYSVFMSSTKAEKCKLDIGENEVNVIKKIFINKIGKAYKTQSDNEIKNIIIEINVTQKDFKVFIETPFGKVEQFNYFKQ